MAAITQKKFTAKSQAANKRTKKANYGSFLANLAEDNSVDETQERESDMATASLTPGSAGNRRKGANRRPYAFPEYDPRMDLHQQTYVLSPLMMYTLQKTIRGSGGKVFTLPDHKVGFHAPRRPLLLSYPTKPTNVGKAIYLNRVLRKSVGDEDEMKADDFEEDNFPNTKEAREFVRMAMHMRTGAARTEFPSPRRLKRPKTVAPTASRAERLSREKGFILDGVALSNIQEDYAKVQPKLGAAIPPYNAHFDRSVTPYFNFKGVKQNLTKTGQTRRNSVSIQGKYVDRFHFIGDGHIYMHRRNKAGAGYSNEMVNGHAQFMSGIGPMDGYNGKYGFRRNTPILRNCPTPFGTASRSPTH